MLVRADRDMYAISKLGDGGFILVSSAWYMAAIGEVRVHFLDQDWNRRSVVIAQDARGATFCVRDRTAYVLYSASGSQNPEIKAVSINVDKASVTREQSLGYSDAQVVDPTLGDIVALDEKIFVGWATSARFTVDRYSSDLGNVEASWISKRPAAFRPRLSVGGSHLYVALTVDEGVDAGDHLIITLDSNLREVRRSRGSERLGFEMAFSSKACALVTSAGEVFDGQRLTPLAGLESWLTRNPTFEEVRLLGSYAYFVRLDPTWATVLRRRLRGGTFPCRL